MSLLMARFTRFTLVLVTLVALLLLFTDVEEVVFSKFVTETKLPQAKLKQGKETGSKLFLLTNTIYEHGPCARSVHSLTRASSIGSRVRENTKSIVQSPENLANYVKSTGSKTTAKIKSQARILVFADQHFQKRYSVQIKTLRCYANRHKIVSLILQLVKLLFA